MAASATLLQAAVHSAAELLPVSSSGHSRAVGGRGDAGAHLVPVAVTLVAWRADVAVVLRRLDARRVGMHLLAGGVPAAVGVAVGDRRERLPLAAGLLAGAAVLAAANRADGMAAGGAAGGAAGAGARGSAPARGGGRSRWDADLADGLWLGLAQAAALWPGVSRLGTTLAVARLRGFAADEAPLLAREVGVPVTFGALVRESPSFLHRPATRWSRSTARRAVDLDHPPRARVRAGARNRVPGGVRMGVRAAVEVAGAVTVLPLARRVDRGASLAPFAAERALLALLLLARERRRR